MRGVYSMAALAELQRLGCGDVFSCAAGASTGAINLAYFLAGRAEAAVAVYTETISNTARSSIRSASGRSSTSTS